MGRADIFVAMLYVQAIYNVKISIHVLKLRIGGSSAFSSTLITTCLVKTPKLSGKFVFYHVCYHFPFLLYSN